MNERQRMQYLEAMGIDCYVPRWRLLGAKVSQVCDLPLGYEHVNSDLPSDEHGDALKSEDLDEFAARASRQGANAETSRIGSIVADLNDSMTSNPAKKVDPVEVANPGFRHHAVQDESNTAQFSLALWRASPDIQVVDSRSHGDALPTHALLSNMLVFMSALSLNLPKAEYLNWPMIDREHDKSWPAAREMVQGFFEGRFSSQPVKTLLVFGQDAFMALCDQEGITYEKQLYERCFLDLFSADALVLPSLSEILYSPQLKLRVWSSLLRLSSPS